MILQNKIVPVALGAALLGGSVGAFVMRPAKQAEVASAHTATQNAQAVPAQNLSGTAATGAQTLAASTTETSAFREGFAEGVRAAREEGLTGANAVAAAPARATTQRVVYRNSAPRTRYARSRASSGRQVYYDYDNRPRGRSFWQKHRDKLTVAMGAGGGALIGGLVGGKKGALIGGLAGGGGSALYTYKLRKRDRRY